MTSKLVRALAAGTAMSLISIAAARAQQAEASGGTVELDAIIVDVGAGADETAGADVIKVDKEEIDRKKPQNLREVFSGEPQIQVGGAIPSTQKIYVNGVDENNLAVTVDGSRQNNKVFHHNGTYLLDPALLKAASVSAGVAPADAGPGALAGSLGFETKDAADLLEPGRNFGGFVTGTYDTNSNTFTTGLSAFGRYNGFEYLGYINYNNGDNFTSGGGEEMEGTGVNLLSGLGKIAYESEVGHRIELSHEQVRDDADRPYRANFYFNRPNEPKVRNYELNRNNTVLTYTDTSPEGWWDPKVVLAYSRTRIETLEYFGVGPDAIISPVDGATSSFNGKAENKFALEMGSVTAGFDFYNDKAALDYLNAASPAFTDERAANIGAYAQARLEPFERTRLSFGGRADHQWFTGLDNSEWTNAGLSGNVSGEYDLVPEFLTLKAGASHVWGGVPLAENFLQNPDWTYGNGPEVVRSNNFIGGLEARYNGFTFEANLFRTEIDNARLTAYGRGTPPVPELSSIRTSDLVSQGFEIGGRYNWEQGFVSVKYANTESEVDDLPSDTETGRYLTTPVGEIIMIGAGYTFVDWGLQVGGDIEIALPYDGSYENGSTEKKPLDGYEVVNAFVEWTPPSKPNFTLRADAKNIFDEDYTDRAAYGQDFLDVKPHSDPGRSFRLSATMRF